MAAICPQQQDQQRIPAGIIDEDMKLSMAFQQCIVNKMDDAFMAKFNQTFPIKETNVQISSSSNDVTGDWRKVTYEYQDDPCVLQVEQKGEQFKILNQLLDVNEVKQFIRDEGLTASHQSIVLIVSKKMNAGVQVSLMDAVKAAGFKQTSMVSLERLAAMNGRTQ